MAAQRDEKYLAKLVGHLHLRGNFVLTRLPRVEPRLHRWAVAQRELWRTGRLDVGLERQLRKIGFPLEVAACEWEALFASVQAYRATHDRFPTRESPRGQWLEAQRALLRRGLLPPDREERLRQLGAVQGEGKGRSA